jgi:carboxymethylenebutenolidase
MHAGSFGIDPGGTRTLAPMPNRRAAALRLVLTAFFAVILACSARAQDWARANLEKSPRHREYVPIKASGRVVNTFVVYPKTSKKAPVIVMIHEIFGLSDWVKSMADDLAAQGYIVLAPDLLSGTGPASGPGSGTPSQTTGGTESYTSMDAVTKAVSGLPPEQVLSDLDGKKLPSANGKLVVAGFCWGGGKSFAFATHRKDLADAFVFYGPPPAAEAMTNIKAPVYGFYAGNDARIDATIPATVEAMKAAGKVYEPVTYDGAGHGFMRAGVAPDATPDNVKARTAAFARMIAVLKPLQ